MEKFDDKSLFIAEYISGGKKFDMLSLCTSSIHIAPVFENTIAINFVLTDDKLFLPSVNDEGKLKFNPREVKYSKEDFDKDFEDWETGDEPTLELTRFDRTGKPIDKIIWRGISGMTFFECDSTYVYPIFEMNDLFTIDFKSCETVGPKHWYVVKGGRTVSDYDSEDAARELASQIGGEVAHD